MKPTTFFDLGHPVDATQEYRWVRRFSDKDSPWFIASIIRNKDSVIIHADITNGSRWHALDFNKYELGPEILEPGEPDETS